MLETLSGCKRKIIPYNRDIFKIGVGEYLRMVVEEKHIKPPGCGGVLFTFVSNILRDTHFFQDMLVLLHDSRLPCFEVQNLQLYRKSKICRSRDSKVRT
jgi:hypothetical protein